MPELNDIICPTCEDEGRIVTSQLLGEDVYAQWICDQSHIWISRSEWHDNLANYVIIDIINLENENA